MAGGPEVASRGTVTILPMSCVQYSDHGADASKLRDRRIRDAGNFSVAGWMSRRLQLHFEHLLRQFLRQ